MQIAFKLCPETKAKIWKGISHILWTALLTTIAGLLLYITNVLNEISDPVYMVLISSISSFLYNALKEFAKGKNVDIDKKINKKAK